MIGWVYESPRDKQKEADQNLEDFYAQDRIDDLEATKDAEIEALQEQIDAWDLYLKALEWRYNEWDRMERERLLKQLLNVETEEEIREALVNDMNEFNLSCEGSYKNYIGIFTNFLDEYRQNLEMLAELNRQQIQLMNATQFMSSNNSSINTNNNGLVNNNNSSSSSNNSNLNNGYGSRDEFNNAIQNAFEQSQATGNKVDLGGGLYIDASKVKGSYAEGLENGPVTDTGLAMLHGSPDKPEYVLNNDQAYNMLENLSNIDGEKNNLNEGKEIGKYSDLSSSSSSELDEAGNLESGKVNNTIDGINFIIKQISNLINTQNLTNSQLIQAIVIYNRMIEFLNNLESNQNLLQEITNNNFQNLFSNLDSGLKILQDYWEINNETIQEQLDSLETISENISQILDQLSQGFSGVWSGKLDNGRWSGGMGGVSSIGNSSNGSGNYYELEEDNSPSWTQQEMEEGFINSSSSSNNSNLNNGYGSRDEFNNAIQNAFEQSQATGNKIDLGGGLYIDASKVKGSYADGLESGPVTYTGLAMLHGSPNEPEFVLNSDQAYNMLKHIATARTPEFEEKKEENNTSYIVQGDIVLQDVNDPQNFWKSVTNAMNNRWNVTKNKK